MDYCKDCKWYYKEHCSNGNSDNCTESVGAYGTCQWHEGKFKEVE